MKKFLLSATSALLVTTGFSQSSIKLTPAQNNFKLSAPVHTTEVQHAQASQMPNIGDFTPVERSATETQIGQSYYDLQTNSSIQRRILRHANSTTTATWTFSTDAAWTARGTGYNYHNGSSWGSVPSTTIEPTSERTGWPNPLRTGQGKEYITAHSTVNSILHRMERAQVGSGTWSQSNLNSSTESFIQVWSRSSMGGSNNNTIHLVGMTLPTANAGTPYNGMDGAFLYSRSTNGGSSFDIVNYQIPGTNVNYFDGFDGDSYSIDAQGNDVAIVVGGLGRGVQLFKSTNNGVNWTKTDVMTSAVWFDEASTLIDTTLADRLLTSDGSVTVLLDGDGMAHVWFGTMYIANTDLTDGTLTYYPYTNSIEYWNEDFPGDNTLRLFGMLDLNNNNILDIDNPGGQYRFAGLVSHPQAGISADGCIYLSYTSLREDLSSGTQAYRHNYVTSSCDGGCSWSFPIDVTGSSNNNFVECAFPSIARKVDDDIHIIYMADNEPGIAVSGDMDSPVINKMIYLTEDRDRFDTTLICPVEIAGDSFLCAGGAVEVQALGCATSYAWTGPSSFTSSNQVIQASSFGTYTCVFNTAECGAITRTFNVVAYNGSGGPNVTVAASTLEMCPGGSSTLTANSNISGVNYTWSNGATTAATTVSTPGTYTVTVQDCNSGTTTQSVTIVQPAAPVAIISGDLELCAGDQNTLTVLPVVDATYDWSTSASGQSINVTSAGTYTVTVTNCSGTSTKSVVVTLETVPTATILSDETTACDGEPLTVTATGGSAFLWSDGSTDPSLTVNSVSQTGTYTVTVYNDCGDEATADIILTIIPKPAAPQLTFNGTNYTSSQTGTHIWYINGAEVTGQTGNTISYTLVPVGSILTCAYVDENGCASEKSNTFIGVVGIEENSGLNGNISIYPNPNNGQFDIRFADATGEMKISLVNSIGQVVYSSLVQAKANTIQSVKLTDVAAGAYQLKIEGNQELSIKTIVIQ